MAVRIRSVLVLDGTPPLRGLERVAAEVRHAASPLEAGASLALAPPDVVVLSGEVEWHRAFINKLTSERRPAVLGVGRAATPAEGVDEWLTRPADESELGFRLRLSEQRASERRRASRRAFVDSLTGLPNRRASVRALLREADRAKRTGTKVSLALIDLDDFKRVNDEGGHPAGDRVLKRVGTILRRLTRTSELCGRIGGDEFALIVAGDGERARVALERVLGGLRSAGIQASGAAAEQLPGERLRELYRRADLLLEAAKTRGRRGRLPGLAPTVGAPASPEAAERV